MSILKRAPLSSGRTEATVPMSVTMPVNIRPPSPIPCSDPCRTPQSRFSSKPAGNRISVERRRDAAGADLGLAAEQHDAVDQPVVEKGPRRLGATLDHDAGQAARRQILEQFRQRDAAFESLGGEEADASPFQCRLARRIGFGAGRDENAECRAPIATSFEDSGSRAWRSSTMRTGERVSRPGSRTLSSGSSASAVPMPTRIASDRARIKCTCRRAISPVMAICPAPARPIMPSRESASLRVDFGALLRRSNQIGGHQVGGLGGEHVLDHLDAGCAQHRVALAGDARIGIAGGADDARDAGR